MRLKNHCHRNQAYYLGVAVWDHAYLVKLFFPLGRPIESKKKTYLEVEEQKDLSAASSLHALPRNTFRHGGYSCRTRHTPAGSCSRFDSIHNKEAIFIPGGRNPFGDPHVDGSMTRIYTYCSTS